MYLCNTNNINNCNNIIVIKSINYNNMHVPTAYVSKTFNYTYSISQLYLLVQDIFKINIKYYWLFNIGIFSIGGLYESTLCDRS